MEIGLLLQTPRTNANHPLCVDVLLSPHLIHLIITHLVLNKCDLLQAKLQRGIRIRDSVPSFGDRKNDLPTATRCRFFAATSRPRVLIASVFRLPTTLQGDSSAVLTGPAALLCSSHLCNSA